MPREHDDTVSLGERLLHTLEMVDLDVVTEVLLVQHRHREDVEHIPCHIDEGGTHEFLCLCLTDTEGRHHMLDGAVSHLRNQQIVEVAEQPPCTEQEGTRRTARKPTEKHECMVEHCRTSFLLPCYWATLSTSV